MSPRMPQQLMDNDDKYAKFESKAGHRETISKTCDAFGCMSLRELTIKDLRKVYQSPMQIYTCFLMVGCVLYHYLGGTTKGVSILGWLGYLSTIAEGFGLLSLRHKIMAQGSVKGISGMTIAMYTLTYTLRLYELWPRYSVWAQLLEGWAVMVLSFASLIMVVDILRAVFVTYRSSYQRELDVLKLKHLIPSCVLLALVFHPSFDNGPVYSYEWAFSFYVDVLALMPQVVMMSQGKGTVEAPISHFVAATTVSRVVDLWWWYYQFDLGPQGYIMGFNYSGWLIVVVHVFSLLLVADFVYYYVKARLSGSDFSADLALPTDDIC